MLSQQNFACFCFCSGCTDFRILPIHTAILKACCLPLFKGSESRHLFVKFLLNVSCTELHLPHPNLWCHVQSHTFCCHQHELGLCCDPPPSLSISQNSMRPWVLAIDQCNLLFLFTFLSFFPRKSTALSLTCLPSYTGLDHEGGANEKPEVVAASANVARRLPAKSRSSSCSVGTWHECSF